MIPVLQTERLTMRGPEADDFPLYRDFYADAEGSGHYGGPKRADEAFQRLAADIGHWHLKGFGKWILVERASGKAVGGCGIVHPDGWPSHELTWWLTRDARGTGYATEASRAAITFGYEALGWDTVETHMRDTNTAARALVTRLGAEVIRRETFPDGVTRDVFRLPRTEETTHVH